MGGAYTQSSTGQLSIEIGSVGSNDVLNVTGAASLSGAVSIDLINAFTPTSGNIFTILTAASVADMGLTLSGESGGFSLIFNSTSVVLSFSGGTLAGDYNSDGKVDAADYVVWRRTDGSPAGYNVWRSNFGAMSGSGSGFDGGTSVPEPAGIVLIGILIVGLLGSLPRGR